MVFWIVNHLLWSLTSVCLSECEYKIFAIFFSFWLLFGAFQMSKWLVCIWLRLSKNDQCGKEFSVVLFKIEESVICPEAKFLSFKQIWALVSSDPLYIYSNSTALNHFNFLMVLRKCICFLVTDFRTNSFRTCAAVLRVLLPRKVTFYLGSPLSSHNQTTNLWDTPLQHPLTGWENLQGDPSRAEPLLPPESWKYLPCTVPAAIPHLIHSLICLHAKQQGNPQCHFL